MIIIVIIGQCRRYGGAKGAMPPLTTAGAPPFQFTQNSSLEQNIPTRQQAKMEKEIIRGGVENTRLEAKAKDTKNPRPRPRTAFPRTDSLEAKDRNARGQGPRTQPQVFSKKNKVFEKVFRQSPIYRRSQNF